MTTINVSTGSLTLSGVTTAVRPAIQRGQSTFNSPLLPQPPSLLKGQFHPDPEVKELIVWANALSQRLQELLDE